MDSFRVARGALLAMSMASLSSGCGGLAKNMQAASRRACQDVLDKHPAIAADARYGEQRFALRGDYERTVADCLLHADEPAKALALAKTWEDGSVDRLKVTARASAALGDDETAREALESLAKSRNIEPDAFVVPPEFARYVGKDWYVELALRVWARHPSGRLESFAARLVGVRPDALLTLSVASADERLTAGGWALWTGIVHNARLDRDASKTVLFAEGVDVSDQVKSRERILEKTETTLVPSWQRKAVTTPTYRTEVEHEEQFKPNGREFVIEARGAKPALVELRTIVAFGRYAGRTGPEGRPMLDALVVIERKAKSRQTSE